MVHSRFIVCFVETGSLNSGFLFPQGYPHRSVSEIFDGQNLWQCHQRKKGLTPFSRSTIPQKQFFFIMIIIMMMIIIIIIIITEPSRKQMSESL